MYSIVENHICLEHIFMHLDIETLLSVAHSNKLFQTLAVSVFKRKYGNNIIDLRCSQASCFHFWIRAEKEISIGPESIQHLKVIFPLLRVFGAEILKLEVHYHSFQFGHSDLDKSKRWSMTQRIDEYINKYCADTLVRIDFLHKLKFSYDFPKPFTKIEQVRIQFTHLQDNLLDFIDWFPNLQHFEINAECIDRRFSHVTFPHLKDLIISFGDFPITLNDGEKNCSNEKCWRIFESKLTITQCWGDSSLV